MAGQLERSAGRAQGRGGIVAEAGAPDAADQLLGCGDRAGGRGSAHETYLEALGAAIFAGRLGGQCGVREVAEPPVLLLEGVATRFTEGYVAGVPALGRALQAFRREGRRRENDN